MDITLAVENFLKSSLLVNSMDNLARNETALAFGAIAQEAGKSILAAPVLTTADIGKKPDGSPVTRADLDADSLIRSRLAALMPGVPVVSEEAVEAWPSTLPGQFILVDPLDGTREFVAGRPEYTVNIALIEAGQPIVGAIYAPAFRRLYVGGAEACRADVAPRRAIAGTGAPATVDDEGRAERRTSCGREPLSSRSGDPTMARPAPSCRTLLTRIVAQVLHDCGRRSRRIPAARADHGMGHGGRTCDPGSRRRMRARFGRIAHSLRQIGRRISQWSVRCLGATATLTNHIDLRNCNHRMV